MEHCGISFGEIGGAGFCGVKLSVGNSFLLGPRNGALTAPPVAQLRHLSLLVQSCSFWRPVLEFDGSCRSDIEDSDCQVLSLCKYMLSRVLICPYILPIHSSHFILLNPIVMKYLLQNAVSIIPQVLTAMLDLRAISKRPIG